MEKFRFLPNITMLNLFHRNFKNFVELEVRKGFTGGDYSVAKMKLGSLPKKDLHNVLVLLNEIAKQTQQVN